MRLLAVSHPSVVDVNQRLYRSLEAMGHDVTLVVPARWRHEYSPALIRPTRLAGFAGEIIELKVANPGSVPFHVHLARASAVIARARPDVVYLEAESYSLVSFQWSLASSRRDVPMAFYAAQNIARHYPLPSRLLEAAVWRRSRAAAAISGEAVDALRQRGYRGDARVVPLSVEMEAFRPISRSTTLARELGLRRQVIGFMGRLTEEKGVRVLLQAYRSLPAAGDVSLLLIGSGPLAAECRATPGAVVVEGVAHLDVPRYIALFDVLAIPSLTTPHWKDQFGRVAIEAMAGEVPVVGSASGYIPELLQRTGGGTVVPEGDAAALAAELGRLLADSRERESLGRRGREGVARVYSNEVAARAMSDLLAEVAA